MESRNCPRCGRLFQYIRTPICEACVKEEDKIFETVREHLEENPGSTIIETSGATGVSVKKITRYLREGRLEITKGMADAGELTCMDCARPIRSGRYCESCLIKLSNDVDEMFGRNKIQPDPLKQKGKPRMHTAER